MAALAWAPFTESNYIPVGTSDTERAARSFTGDFLAWIHLKLFLHNGAESIDAPPQIRFSAGYDDPAETFGVIQHRGTTP